MTHISIFVNIFDFYFVTLFSLIIEENKFNTFRKKENNGKKHKG